MLMPMLDAAQRHAADVFFRHIMPLLLPLLLILLVTPLLIHCLRCFFFHAAIFMPLLPLRYAMIRRLFCLMPR